MTRIEYEVDLRRLLYKKWKRAKAQSKLRNTASSALLQKKGSFVYEVGMCLRSMNIFTKHGFSSLRSMKRREGVFSPKAQKRYVYKVSCIAKNWIINNLHIRFKNMHIEYYSLDTAKLHWSSKNVFTISTSTLSGPSPQLHLTTC
jgi:6-phosphogluconate dehydrogenase